MTETIIQIIGIIGFLLCAYSTKYPNNITYKILTIIISLIFSLQLYLMGLNIPAFIFLLNAFRAFFSARTKSFIVMSIFILIHWSVGYYLFEEAKDILPLISVTVGTYSIFRLKDIPFRCAILFTNSMWMAISIMESNIGLFLSNLLGFSLQLYFIFKEKRDLKIDNNVEKIV